MPAPPSCLDLLSPEITPNLRATNLAWFREAKFGLFLHYGLYSLLEGRWDNPYVSDKGAEWIQWWAPVPRKEYMALRDRFTAERFDADAICSLAVEAGMHSVNLTTQHDDGFSLWDTATNDSSSIWMASGNRFRRITQHWGSISVRPGMRLSAPVSGTMAGKVSTGRFPMENTFSSAG